MKKSQSSRVRRRGSFAHRYLFELAAVELKLTTGAPSITMLTERDYGMPTVPDLSGCLSVHVPANLTLPNFR